MQLSGYCQITAEHAKSSSHNKSRFQLTVLIYKFVEMDEIISCHYFPCFKGLVHVQSLKQIVKNISVCKIPFRKDEKKNLKALKSTWISCVVLPV